MSDAELNDINGIDANSEDEEEELITPQKVMYLILRHFPNEGNIYQF